ncbi:MAG: hypothetical protein HN742_03670 [Lentisphaerae bacterium]|nr:hypothetical protein [Lentisphaerota bacterium]MBT5605326.1 hypothetical protein [Lentisphaerota bacterium]MBT7055884.1 hypothetical protein [Lentisphaerota bacterium]MBT7840940.1 hypothetical protein [Lentisphaerota bacterium]
MRRNLKQKTKQEAPPKRASGPSPAQTLIPRLIALLALTLCPDLASARPPTPVPHIHVAPNGNDTASGSSEAPLRTLWRARELARHAAQTAQNDVVVDLAPGIYRLDHTFELTNDDSGRDGNQVVYRSAGGPGKARLLGSVPITGWKPHSDGVWKAVIPADMTFHTLYENGKRAHKARFPNYEHSPHFPTARGPYLVTEDGAEGFEKGKGTAWLTYADEDTPPVTDITKMRVFIYLRGKCDWMRSTYRVRAIDPDQRRIALHASRLHFGILARARYFLEDELSFLDAPGEFYLDDGSRTLYYHPMGDGHPETLGISAPVLTRLIQIKGESPDRPTRNIRLEGLALEETDGFPKGWWSTRYGIQDGALVWLSNATGIEVRDCHLKNSGRSGIMLIGHATANVVKGCWIEHMGLNGVTLSNRWRDKNHNNAKLSRCERNWVTNCRMHNIGEVHTYAACVNLFNVSHNEISHCEMHDSVRYAVTVRGNTGTQYGPPVWTDQPQCKDNRIHHLRTYRCGQDGGDMGTLHCANLNNPDGGCVNTFEQITVADSQAVSSMKDIGPDGIFLDWPKMSMDQIFRNVHIIRSQDKQIRSNRPENAASAQTTNVSWKPGFRTDLMDYQNIGVTATFPTEFGAGRSLPRPPSAPQSLRAETANHHTVALSWDAPDHRFTNTPRYTVFRDGKRIAVLNETSYADAHLPERTKYRYEVAAQDGDFCHNGPRSPACHVRTPPDLVPPEVDVVTRTHAGGRVRIVFSKPVSHRSALTSRNYRFTPTASIQRVRRLAPNCVELTVQGLPAQDECFLSIANVTDTTPARNMLQESARLPVLPTARGASYTGQLTHDGLLLDSLGGGGDATLHGDATIQPGQGPFGGPALVLDGDGDYAEASPNVNLGAGDFTLMAWMWREKSSSVAISKGNGFGSEAEWSFGWNGQGVSDSASFRLNNVFRCTGASSVPRGKWTHVAFVRRGNQGITYANGEVSGSPHDLSEVGDLTNAHPLRLGRRAHEPDPAYFRGKLARVLILTHALSPREIETHARGK